MLEVAAGAIAAEEAVSTTIQGAAVAVAVAQPTGPLKATFSQMASAPQSDSPDSLARSNHTVTFSDGNLHIYGGIVAKSTLAGPEMHIFRLSNAGGSGSDYKSIPPIAEAETDPTPCARASHAIVAIDEGPNKGKLIMYGGYGNADGQIPLDEKGRVWIFDTATMFWSCVNQSEGAPEPGPRANHVMVPYENSVILHGGKTASPTAPHGEESPSDTWLFDLESKSWVELPPLSSAHAWTAPSTPASPPLFSISDHKIWTMTAATDGLSTNMHFLDIKAWRSTTTTENPSDMASGEEEAPWNTLTIPTNPLTPGPSLRSGATVHIISTGMGRRYLLLMLGASTSNEGAAATPSETMHSTLWTLQLPSSYSTPAAAKDATRDSLPGTRSHTLEWHSVEVVPKDEAAAGAAQQGWLDSARSGVQGFLKTNVGGAASWVRRTASVAGSRAYDLASPSGSKSGPTSPTTEAEHAGPVLEDKEAAAESGGPEAAPELPSEVTHVEPVPEEAHAPEKPAAEAASTETTVVSGKAHPGPRSFFGSAVLQSPLIGMGLGGANEHPAQVLMWGGLSPNGEREGDGWLIELRV